MKTTLCVVVLGTVLALSVESIPPLIDPNQPIPPPPGLQIPGAPPVDDVDTNQEDSAPEQPAQLA